MKEVCSQHSGLVEILKNIEDKMDNQVSFCIKNTNDMRKEDASLDSALVRLDEKVNWLVRDRQEQKERYEKKTQFYRRVQYSVAVGVASVVSYLFVHREEIKIIIREWLLQ